MKKVNLPNAVVGALIVLALSTTARAQDKPTSYPLLCRGSKDSKIVTSSAAAFAVLDFHKGNQPAESGLAPGECSWMDRGIREGEPGSLIQGASTSSLVTGRSDKKLDWGWIEALKDSDKYWMFYVYNERGALVVTDSKPYKKMEVAGSIPSVEAAVPRVTTDPRAMTETRLPTLEPNTNRAGQDYKSFELTDAQPYLCQKACVDDPSCKAFTYVKPGIQGARAMCWLKSAVPAASADSCCVSGVKPATRKE